MSAVGDARKRREEAVAAAFAPLVERQAQVEALVAAAERRGFERGAGVRGDVAAVALRVVREHQPTKWDASRGGWLDDLYCTCGVLIALGDAEAFGPEWEVHVAAALAAALASDRDEQARAASCATGCRALAVERLVEREGATLAGIEATGPAPEAQTDRQVLIDAFLDHLPDADDCEEGGLVCSKPEHLADAALAALARHRPEADRAGGEAVAAALDRVAARVERSGRSITAIGPIGDAARNAFTEAADIVRDSADWERRRAALSTGTTRDEAVVKAEALREAADDWPLGSCAHRCFRTDPHTAPKDCLHGPDWLRDRAAALATGAAPGGGQDG